MYRLIKKITKEVLQKFKLINLPESAAIVQACTAKIGLRDYLYSI